jgi:hypothetical protein
MQLFVLTPEEKRVVAFVMLMILVGVCVQEYRKRHPVPPVPIEVQKHPWMRKLPPLPSVTPQVTEATGSATPRPKRSRKPRKPKPTPAEEQPENDSAAPDAENQPPA